jgi:hypothetical protein
LANLWGADEVRAVQRLAVEESRLGIPLRLGLDVVHGHRSESVEELSFAHDAPERQAESRR